MELRKLDQGFRRNVLVLGAASFFNLLAGSLASIILAWALSTEEFAKFGVYFRSYTWLCAFAGFLIPPILVRYTAELKSQNRWGLLWSLIALSWKLQIVVTAALSLLFCLLALTFQWYPWEAVIVIILAALSFALMQVYEPALRGLSRFSSVAAGQAAGGIAKLLGYTILLLSGGAATVAILVIAAANAVSLSIYRNQLSWKTTRRKLSSRFLKRAASYGGSMGVAGFLSIFIWNYQEIFFLSYFWADHQEGGQQIAIYTLAIALAALPVRFVKILSQVLLPRMTEFYTQRDTLSLNAFYQKVTITSTAIGVYIGMASIIFASPIFRFIFPDDLESAAEIFQLLMIPAILLTINQGGAAAIPAMEGHRALLIITGTLAPMSIILNLLIIPAFGALGAAFINVFIQGSAVALSMVYVVRRRKLNYPVSESLRILTMISLGIFSILFVSSTTGSHLYSAILFGFFSSLYFLWLKQRGVFR